MQYQIPIPKFPPQALVAPPAAGTYVNSYIGPVGYFSFIFLLIKILLDLNLYKRYL